jgi:hypothetical protein
MMFFRSFAARLVINRSMALDPATRTSQLAELLAEPPPRHRISPELRKAALRQAAPWFWIPFGAIFAGMGLLFSVMFIPWKYAEDLKLKDGGATAAGTVLGVTPTGMSINNTQVMRYEFEFRPAAGNVVRAECFTTGSRWHVGEKVTVRYLPGDPAVSVIEGARRSEGTLGVAFVLVFPFVGFGFIAWVLVSRRRVNGLLQRGQVTEALVTRIDETSFKINRQSVHAIALQGVDGAALTARHHEPAIVGFARERMATRQPVFVLYDPARPKRVLLPETWT